MKVARDIMSLSTPQARDFFSEFFARNNISSQRLIYGHPHLAARVGQALPQKSLLDRVSTVTR